MKPAPETFHVKSFGCQMNVYDGDRMAELMASDGLVAADADVADLVILNTCHIRERATEKVYSDIGRHSQGCRQARGRRTPMIAVAGCVAQAEGQEIVDARQGRRRGRSAGLSQLARAGREGGAGRQRRARYRHARAVEVRPPARAPPRPALGVPDGAGGVRQILYLLRRTLYPREPRSAVRSPRSSTRRRRWSMRARARSRCWGRTSTPGRTTGRMADGGCTT